MASVPAPACDLQRDTGRLSALSTASSVGERAADDVLDVAREPVLPGDPP
jgi:hypothetical protein